MSDAEYTPQVQDDEKLDAYFLYEKQISNRSDAFYAHTTPQVTEAFFAHIAHFLIPENHENVLLFFRKQQIPLFFSFSF